MTHLTHHFQVNQVGCKEKGMIEMALRIVYDTTHGINCPEAHCVISRTKCFQEETHEHDTDENDAAFRMTYNGEIYYDEQSYLDGKTPVAGFNMGISRLSLE